MKRPSSIGTHLECAAAAAAACLCAAPAVAQTPTAPPLAGPGSISGVWAPMAFKDYRTGPPGDPNRAADDARTAAKDPAAAQAAARNRAAPPYQPWAQAVADANRKRVAELTAAGKPPGYDGPGCRPSAGFPAIMSPPAEDVMQVLETPDQKQVTVIGEFYGVFRIIHLDEPHSADPDPTYMGEAVGHWEGGTLVVDTIALNDKVDNPDGIKHSDQLHYVEHIRRIDKDHLEDRVTVDDPKVYTKPWDRVITLKKVPGLRVSEWVCDNQRNGANPDGSTGVKLTSN